MKIDPPWARAAEASGPAASASASTATMTFLTLIRCLLSRWAPTAGGPQTPLPSVWKGPQAKLFLGDVPEPCEPVRLHDQKEDDEPAEDHQLDLLLQRDGEREPERVGRVGEE